MVSSAVYSNRCVTTLEKHDRKAAWRICLLNGVTTDQPRSLSSHFVYVCVCVFSECANLGSESNMSMHVRKKGLAIISGALQPCLNWDPVSAEVKYCCDRPRHTFRILMSLLLLGAWFFFWHVSAILQLAVSWIQQEISLMEQHRAVVVLYRDTLFFFLCRSFLIFYLHVLVSLGPFLCCLELRGAVYRTEYG